MKKLHLAIDGSSLDCLIIGGGSAAAIKLRTLTDAGCSPSILAPTITPEVAEIMQKYQLPYFCIPYTPNTLTTQNYHLVVIATDSYELNNTIAIDCQQANILYILTSDAARSPVHSPATTHIHGITLSIYADGLPMLSRQLRDHFLSMLPSDSSERIHEMHTIRKTIVSSTIAGASRRSSMHQALSPLVEKYIQKLGEDHR